MRNACGERSHGVLLKKEVGGESLFGEESGEVAVAGEARGGGVCF